MATSVQCAQCGKQYQAGPNLAGKRIKCKECGATISIPAGGQSPPPAKPPAPAAGKPAPAGSGAISAACGNCGQKFQVKAELAGKRVKCQQCGGVVAIPGGSSAAPAGQKAAKPAAAKPAAATAAPAAKPAAAPPRKMTSLVDEEFAAGAMPTLPTVGQRYCPGCKAIISANSVLCVKCGLRLDSGRTMVSDNAANKPKRKPGEMTAWGILAAIVGLLYGGVVSLITALLAFGSIMILLALGLPTGENPQSVVAMFGLPVFILLFTAAMLMIASSIGILRKIKGAIPNAALASKIFVWAYIGWMCLVAGNAAYTVYRAKYPKKDDNAVAAAPVDPNKEVAPPPTFRGPAALLSKASVLTAVSAMIIIWMAVVTAILIGPPIYIWAWAGTQGKRIDWELPEPTYKPSKGAGKIIDASQKPDLAAATAGGIRCPNCGSGSSTRVFFTWWGGMLGPALFGLTRCDGCSQTYNGRTGKDCSTGVAIYIGVSLTFAVICGAAAVFAKMAAS